jgi:hypothetical protein
MPESKGRKKAQQKNRNTKLKREAEARSRTERIYSLADGLSYLEEFEIKSQLPAPIFEDENGDIWMSPETAEYVDELDAKVKENQNDR